ncbi:ribose-phosphate diphosphokinase [Candidatus Uhrbacteria bacterium]|nr:ribose-phosphate diphosphokinase [Candidatus Uhrbacteria bacterium]
MNEYPQIDSSKEYPLHDGEYEFAPKPRLKIFSGTAHPALAEGIADRLGLTLRQRKIVNFADGEIYVQIQESVRGMNVFVVQPTCPPAVNAAIMELELMLDALKRASPRQLVAVMPYFAYARQDRPQGREPLSAELVARKIENAGATRTVLLDIHSPQTRGFFKKPCDPLFATPVILKWLEQKQEQHGEIVIVSPDAGGVTRARVFAKKLSDRAMNNWEKLTKEEKKGVKKPKIVDIAIIDKRRTGHNKIETGKVVGHVKGKVAVVVDDMIDTAGTLAGVGRTLKKSGARYVLAAATHPVFSGKAIENLLGSPFKEIAVTSSIPISEDKRRELRNLLTILPIEDLLADAVLRIHQDITVSPLFE